MIAEAPGRLVRGILPFMTVPTIRPMLPEDVDAATAEILRGDWGDRRLWFEFTTSQGECAPIVAELDGQVVGTGVGCANGRVGWVGTIYVSPAQRGRGLGRALTQTVIDGLAARGCRTLLLVSTSEGLPLYESLGFEIQTHYRILEAPGIEARSERPAPAGGEAVVRPFETADLAQLAALDAVATGEDRAHVLLRFASATTSKVLASPDGHLRAFVVRAPWGGGATIAPDADDAMAVLRARQVAAGPGGRVRVGLVEENAVGLERLEREGLVPIWSAPRLIRGDSFAWSPSWIWGQFNHALG